MKMGILSIDIENELSFLSECQNENYGYRQNNEGWKCIPETARLIGSNLFTPNILETKYNE